MFNIFYLFLGGDDTPDTGSFGKLFLDIFHL